MKATGKRVVQCAACEQSFGGAISFDRHRTGEFTSTGPKYGRRCMNVDEMSKNGMKAAKMKGFSVAVWVIDPESERVQ